jgi:parallel beta-helix repeat protein
LIYKIEGDGITLGGGMPLNVDIKIRDNNIHNNYYAGISASYSEAVEIAGNTVYYNWKSPPQALQPQGLGGNIKLNGTRMYPVKDVTIYNNKIHSAAQRGTGIFVGNATNVRISYNDIYLRIGGNQRDEGLESLPGLQQ